MDAGGCWWISVIHDTHEREHATTIITPCGGWVREKETQTTQRHLNRRRWVLNPTPHNLGGSTQNNGTVQYSTTHNEGCMVYCCAHCRGRWHNTTLQRIRYYIGRSSLHFNDLRGGWYGGGMALSRASARLAWSHVDDDDDDAEGCAGMATPPSGAPRKPS
jgi:hypothetical protein